MHHRADFEGGRRGLWQDTYVCVDIETTGPQPGRHSMISLGAVACDHGRGIFSEFHVNLMELPGATRDPTTSRWWSNQPDAWELTQCDQQSPGSAMASFEQWLAEISARPVILASNPASFDFAYVHWYCYEFLNARIPFLKFGLDINSVACGLTGLSFYESSRHCWPKSLGEPEPAGSHSALDDARNHSRSLLRLIKALAPGY